MARPTVARIDLDAVAHNLQVVRAVIGPRKVCAAVKADAYGHGAPVVCHALERAGVDMFGVSMTGEALDLRCAGITKPIFLLTTVPGEDIGLLLDHDISACVVEEDFACELSVRALNRNMVAEVHVNVDTGMHRVGLDWQTAVRRVQNLADLPGIRIVGLFSHFACSDADDLSFSHEQLRRFKQVADGVKRAGIEVPTVHMANSNGVLRMPDAYFNAVRPGLILYGMASRPGASHAVGLRPVLSLHTRICNVMRVPSGETVGYGGTFTTERETVVATLPVGYHDGYVREFSNHGAVLVGGQRAPVIGRVCMDQTLVDVTDVPEAQAGDEVVLYGCQGEAQMSVEDAARMIGRIPYELTCSISRRVRREFVRDGRRVIESPLRSVVADSAVRRILAETPGKGDENAGGRPFRIGIA